MTELSTYGQWLRYRRETCDLSRDALARQAHCSESSIRQYEAGTRRPSPESATLIARALDVPDAEVPALVKFARQRTFPSEAEVAAAISPRPRPPHPGQLPVARTSFVGREPQIAM